MARKRNRKNTSSAANTKTEQRANKKEMGTVAIQTVKDILAKSNTDPASIDLVICATCTGDYSLPDCANSICYQSGLSKAFGFDVNAACSGFVFSLHTAAQFCIIQNILL